MVPLLRASSLHLMLLFSFAAFQAQGQESQPFPAGWAGIWAGELEIFSVRGKVQSVPMELHIAQIDSATWTWVIIYGEDKVAGKRDYLLRVVNAAMGLYDIDEQNSIVLNSSYLGGKLVEMFEVEGTLLLSTTEKAGDQLIFEILAGGSQPVKTTGGQKVGEEDIPEVKGFGLTTRQKAVLHRKG
jgi:hypothetical protein